MPAEEASDKYGIGRASNSSGHATIDRPSLPGPLCHRRRPRREREAPPSARSLSQALPPAPTSSNASAKSRLLARPPPPPPLHTLVLRGQCIENIQKLWQLRTLLKAVNQLILILYFLLPEGASRNSSSMDVLSGGPLPPLSITMTFLSLPVVHSLTKAGRMTIRQTEREREGGDLCRSGLPSDGNEIGLLGTEVGRPDGLLHNGK